MTTAPADGAPALEGQVRRGVAWGTLNSLVLRAGNLLIGIVVARLLSPEAFGVFAVALTVQTVLVTLADLGMAPDLVRAEDPDRRAPTVATISLASSVLLAGLMAATAVPVATALGSAAAAPVIVVLACTLVISGAGVVPGARLVREFQQSKAFVCDLSNFGVSTVVTIGLILMGMGPMALAWSRLAGQFVGTTLQFVLTRTRFRLGFDRDVAGSALRFGAPLAAANLLSWALLSVDNVVVARTSGEVALGFYVLAFNVSSWPMTVIGQAIRTVTLPAFARRQDDDGAALGRAVGLSAAVAGLAGAMLVVLAVPVVVSLYGARWTPSADALAGLAAFGALRVVLDVLATFLVARGAARPVLLVQVWWIVTLVPAMVLGVRWGGLAGAGWAHVVVGVLLVAPVYLVAVRAAGGRVSTVLGNVWPPLLAAVPAGAVAWLVSGQFSSSWLALAAGGLCGTAVYALLVFRWVRRHAARSTADDGAPVPDAAAVAGESPARA
ncbi:oligosaccharide flippase family protein [Geodermatophilus sp. SYSU D01045]